MKTNDINNSHMDAKIFKTGVGAWYGPNESTETTTFALLSFWTEMACAEMCERVYCGSLLTMD